MNSGMSLIEWTRAVRVDTLTMAADTLARGVESPWCRKIIKDANRNGARNVSPTNRHLAHIVMYFHHHNLLRPAQIHHVMQDSLFQHFTGMQLIR